MTLVGLSRGKKDRTEAAGGEKDAGRRGSTLLRNELSLSNAGLIRCAMALSPQSLRPEPVKICFIVGILRTCAKPSALRRITRLMRGLRAKNRNAQRATRTSKTSGDLTHQEGLYGLTHGGASEAERPSYRATEVIASRHHGGAVMYDVAPSVSAIHPKDQDRDWLHVRAFRGAFRALVLKVGTQSSRRPGFQIEAYHSNCGVV